MAFSCYGSLPREKVKKKIESFLNCKNPKILLPSFIGLNVCKIIDNLLSSDNENLVISFDNIIALIDAQIAIADRNKDDFFFARVVTHYRR